jgi:erythronate-4-phosphate dehydrogenase
MKFVIDQNIPFIRGIFEPFGTVVYKAGGEITHEDVVDADALITRTRTRCDRALLHDSTMRVVATATIGMDHIDVEWCREAGIKVFNAPGCNAPGVAQYVFAAIATLINRPLTEHTLGIIGVGHIGRIVERWARAMGMNVLRCDPPRQRLEGGDWVDINEIADRADIITVHTPMTYDGDDATYHLMGEEFFARLKRFPIVINAARGPIVDTAALVRALDQGLVKDVAIDCWEGEPRISEELLKRAVVATPHIAGYSREGKIRATVAAVNAVSSVLNLGELQVPGAPVPEAPERVRLTAVINSYDPAVDTARLKASPARFEHLRDNYAYRPEVP